MPLHIGNQVPYAFASMVACDFIVQIAKTALDGIGAGAIGGQKQQDEARMLLQPTPNHGGLMNFTAISYHIDPVKASDRVSKVEEVQQIQKQSRHLPEPDTVMYPARVDIQGSGQVAALILAGRHHLDLGGGGHPLCADFSSPC